MIISHIKLYITVNCSNIFLLVYGFEQHIKSKKMMFFYYRFTMDYERQMEKQREMVERELDIEDTGSFLDEEPDEEESEEEEDGVAQEETVDEEETADEEGSAEADDVLQILPDEDADESNDEDEQQATRYAEKQFVGKNKTLERSSSTSSTAYTCT